MLDSDPQTMPAAESPSLSLDELHQLVAERSAPAETLNAVVRLLRTRFQTDVCSVYLLEPDRAHLVLARHDRFHVDLVEEHLGPLRE